MDSKTFTPIAIVVAGLLIAGAILWATTQQNPDDIKTDDIAHDPSRISALVDSAGSTDRTLGNPDAPITLIEYSDTECPFCQRYHETVVELMEKYGPEGTVAWEYRYAPLQSHRKAAPAAEALECIREIGGSKAFWIGLDTIMAVSPGNDRFDLAQLPAIAELAGADRDEFQVCVDSDRYKEDVQNSLQQSFADGLTGTPFSIVEVTEALSPETQGNIEQFDDEIASQQDIFTINADGTRIAFSGALTFDMLDQLMRIIQGEQPQAE